MLAIFVALFVGWLLVILLAIALFFVCRDKRRLGELAWKLKISDLKFSEPPKNIGRGTFGWVVLADYRGKQVAVKRVQPSSKQKIRHDATAAELEEVFDFVDALQKSSNAFGVPPKSEPLEVPFGTERKKSITGNRRESLKRASQFSFSNLRGVNIDVSKSGLILDTVAERSGGDGSTEMETNEEINAPSDTNDIPEGAPSDTDGIPEGCNQEPSFQKVFDFTHSSVIRGRRIFWHRDELTQFKMDDFKTKMNNLSKIHHPCILSILGAVISKEEPLLVMELMEQRSLRDLLHNSTMVFDGEQILHILCDIAGGMSFLHSAKPQ
eukprot:CAMPEP_0194328756 /NCGR_PEP_ID=MMETSP0171-20130528/45879_1 /TAXON_ID=218684 /ORGANISM="Corethron pennatum, Strain L29A3" /LENGTH=323 /DNA_ID=CAMNT_0039089225 /DNA_START=138 /DNA_END=1106 /DNA_ORIENTATION=+